MVLVEQGDSKRESSALALLACTNDNRRSAVLKVPSRPLIEEYNEKNPRRLITAEQEVSELQLTTQLTADEGDSEVCTILARLAYERLQWVCVRQGGLGRRLVFTNSANQLSSTSLK